MTTYPQRERGGEEMERPVATRRPDYKQTNMPRVLITIVLLALLATAIIGGMFFFNLTGFS